MRRSQCGADMATSARSSFEVTSRTDSQRYPADQVKLDLGQAQRWRTLALPHLFERGGAGFDRTALVFREKQRTYRELRDRMRLFAHALIGLGIQPADRVALLSTNRLEYLE